MVPADEKFWMEQFYVSLEPEVRLRRKKANGDYPVDIPYRMAIKGNGSLSRIEIQTPVEEDFYNQALDFVNEEPIQKHTLIYHVDGHEIGIAVVLNVEPFTYAEVEFESEEEANGYQFPWPDIVIREVTDEPEWKMKNYWKRTRKL